MMPAWLTGSLLVLCAVLLAGLWIAFRRSREQARRLRRAIESAGYEVVHGANAARAHLLALEQGPPAAACAAHLSEIRRALERLEGATAILAAALRPESAGAPGSSSAPAPANPA